MPRGFSASGIHCGIKRDAPDLAMFRSDVPCTATGVFTTNAVKGASLVITQLNLRQGGSQAVVVNSGNANACTGSQGLKDALLMTKLTADELDLEPAQVLVASTGVIGRPMPMDSVRSGIPSAAAILSPDGGVDAARAIMTTDLVPKQAQVSLEIGGETVTLGGMAKGSGMIHPNMATLLGFVTSDAAVEPGFLNAALRRAVDRSFNLLSVDGDSSTNDSVLLLSNGMSGAPLIEAGAQGDLFEAGLTELCDSLCRQLAADGEGATKLIVVRVSGAANDGDARTAARSVVSSNLVKSAVHGADPNWGRIICALGYSGAAMMLDRVRLSVGGVPIFERGSGTEADLDAVREHLSGTEIVIEADLGLGEGGAQAYGCDLTAEYVHINADYTT